MINMAREMIFRCKAKKCDHDKLEGQFLFQKCIRCPNFEFGPKGSLK